MFDDHSVAIDAVRLFAAVLSLLFEYFINYFIGRVGSRCLLANRYLFILAGGCN